MLENPGPTLVGEKKLQTPKENALWFLEPHLRNENVERLARIKPPGRRLIFSRRRMTMRMTQIGRAHV